MVTATLPPPREGMSESIRCDVSAVFPVMAEPGEGLDRALDLPGG